MSILIECYCGQHVKRCMQCNEESKHCALLNEAAYREAMKQRKFNHKTSIARARVLEISAELIVQILHLGSGEMQYLH